MDVKRKRNNKPDNALTEREQLIEELLDLLEPDISWQEDKNPRPTQHVRECIKVFRQIRPKQPPKISRKAKNGG